MDNANETRIYAVVTLAVWLAVIVRAFHWTSQSAEFSVRWFPWRLIVGEVLYAGTSILVRYECRRSEAAGEALVRVWRLISATLFVLLLAFGFLAKTLQIA